MKKAHFIGICGVGMSATAKLLQNLGWKISGSDDHFYPPASHYLKKHGLAFTKGYQKENIPKDAELIVIGKNTKLIPEENKEVEAALESGITVRSFPEVLGNLSESKENIVVAGSYGKSTCTALLAWCLLHAGKDPSYFLGAIPIDDTMDTARLAEGKTFVIEGDEYPSSNWDATSKFLHYHPHDVLLTSAAHDHVNVFPTHEEYLVPFKTLLSLLPEDGLLAASADDRSALNLAHAHTGKVVLYGLNEKTLDQKSYDISYDFWSGEDVARKNNTTFTLTKNKHPIVSLETELLGKHNIQNIVGVSAILLEKQLVTPEELREGVRTFRGIHRRLDKKTEKSSVLVYEGFGSSYEKQRAAIEALKLHYPDKKLVTIFEPHTFSWRNRGALPWYDHVFEGSNLVLIYEPALQGAKTHAQLSQEEIVARTSASGTEALPIRSADEALAILDSRLGKNDVILLSTSGDLGGLIEAVPRFVEKKFPIV